MHLLIWNIYATYQFIVRYIPTFLTPFTELYKNENLPSYRIEHQDFPQSANSQQIVSDEGLIKFKLQLIQQVKSFPQPSGSSKIKYLGHIHHHSFQTKLQGGYLLRQAEIGPD